MVCWIASKGCSGGARKKPRDGSIRAGDTRFGPVWAAHAPGQAAPWQNTNTRWGISPAFMEGLCSFRLQLTANL